MQYFDVKRNSGNIFSHGPMISILTDWTLILAKCCRGNESWERILFLLRLKKKWRRKKKEWSSTVPEERESRRSKLIGRQPRRQELQQQLGIRGKHVFVELLISLLVAIHLHRSMRASVRSSSSKKKLHMKHIYTSATRHLLPHKKRGDAMCRCEGFIQPKTHGKSDTQEIRVRRSWSNVNSITETWSNSAPFHGKSLLKYLLKLSTGDQRFLWRKHLVTRF